MRTAESYRYSMRRGAALTEDRARRKAVKARTEMERDVYVADDGR